jgi:hypothetical protein
VKIVLLLLLFKIGVYENCPGYQKNSKEKKSISLDGQFTSWISKFSIFFFGIFFNYFFDKQIDFEYIFSNL